ncbi:alpha/beta fold hydrolase [Cryobacterium roopkundense]|uniref:Pimeloyl-ACP methyl ester carboxylesterase/uncharacterized protein YndB with AHSA1/START domain n=1 Tax=Cryobacterium roopkundense TaxID=1001240 RepID=A0A7W9E5I7_9MICO|nr:alpha/beta fold hydrolase [Cryobacterium roopkundense]MBB5642444.1 pimeloyl-ACP methyl ester carboxylesterase/uncharacterized protein YndB with AHSA1/START domain [Cryobacterium roopkundense]
MSAPHYSVRDEVELEAPPAQVWAQLLAELSGAAQWWLPNNTFVPLAAGLDRIGSSVRVEVRPNGRTSRGPVLSFVATTRESVTNRTLAMHFVSGCFRGEWTFDLEPLAGGRATKLALTMEAEPQGWVRTLARLTDVGEQHSQGVRVAFERLAAVFSGSEVANPARDTAALPSEIDTVRSDSFVVAQDGASVHVTRIAPHNPTTAVHAVLLHGWGSDAQLWADTAAELIAEGVPVVCPDFRGHGATAISGAVLSLDLLAGDIEIVIDSLGQTDFVLVGHSGGGLVALEIAARRPAGLRGLVLASSAARQDQISLVERWVIGSSLLGWALRSARGAEFILSRTMGPGRTFPGRLSVARAFAATAAPVRSAYFAASSAADLRHRLPAIDVPVAVLGGSEDKTLPPRDVRATARELGLVGPIELLGRGHALPVEAPRELAAAILAIMRSAA